MAVHLNPMPLCADCGIPLAPILRRSKYFTRPLCERCFQTEQTRPTETAEKWVLERMFAQPSVVTVTLKPLKQKGRG